MIKMSNHAVLSRDTVPLASFQSALSVSMLSPYVLPTQLLGPGCYEQLVLALCEHLIPPPCDTYPAAWLWLLWAVGTRSLWVCNPPLPMCYLPSCLALAVIRCWYSLSVSMLSLMCYLPSCLALAAMSCWYSLSVSILSLTKVFTTRS